MGMQECADLVETLFARRGFAVNQLPTAGNPVVVARDGGDLAAHAALLQPL